MDKQFWKGKRVLITGHTGFKGSWLSLWLQYLGAQVVGYALPPPSEKNLFDIANVAQGMKSVLGDVRNLNDLKCAFETHKPEIVFHLAAQSLVRASYENPVETYATNLMGTVNVLEAARTSATVRVLVNVTSDKCYENREWVWGYRENEPMGGYDPYSSSKGCSELITSAYRASFLKAGGTRRTPVAVASARAGNVIGGGDWAKDRLVPDMMRALLQGVPLIVRNPNAIRPWQHVVEPLSGYLLLAEKLWFDEAQFAGGWNFGPPAEDAKPVDWIVKRLADKWGDGASWVAEVGSQPHEAHCLTLDSAKARMLLGWRSRWTLDRSLDSIVNWYKALKEGAPMQSVVIRQINEYVDSQ